MRPPGELRLKWRRLTDLLRAMASPHSVIVDRTVYVAAGGGSRDIHKYDLQTQQWTELPQYQYYNFTMAEVNSQLILVGGYDVSTGKTSNAVVVHPTPQGSTQHYPPLNAPRRYPTVSKYHQHLVVAGGCDASLTSLATVETLDISSQHNQWLSTTLLPCSELLSYVIYYSKWRVIPIRRHPGQASSQHIPPSPYTHWRTTFTVAHPTLFSTGELCCHSFPWITSVGGRKSW